MNPRLYLDVDPRFLHAQSSRLSGADPSKLIRQNARFGSAIIWMPPLETYRDCDGELIIYDGVTRATRAAKLQPGHLITVEVLADLPYSIGNLPTIGSLLP